MSEFKSEIDEILQKVKELNGKKLGEIIPIESKDNDKGSIGKMIEENVYGIKNNNKKGPDIEKYNLEVKVTSLKQTKRKKNLTAKERLKICSLNWEEVKKHEFEESDVFKKLKRMIITSYIYETDKEEKDFKIFDTYLFDYNNLNSIDKDIIKRDYKIIRDKIIFGKASTISESDTVILAASRAGQGKGKDLTKVSNLEQKVNRRCFALKPCFMKRMIDYDWNELNKENNEKYIFDFKNQLDSIVEKYSNIDTHDWYKEKYNKTKVPLNVNSLFLKKLIKHDNKSFFDLINSYEYNFRTATLNDNGKIQESINTGFNIDPKNISNSEFYESDEYIEFISKKHIILLFKKDSNGRVKLYDWFELNADNGNNDILDNFEFVWNDTKNKYVNGVQIRINDKGYNSYNFVSIKDKKMFHIRPKARNNKDTYTILSGQKIVKQSFWINSLTINEIYNDFKNKDRNRI